VSSRQGADLQQYDVVRQPMHLESISMVTSVNSFAKLSHQFKECYSFAIAGWPSGMFS
jgi:hypothetical protein